VGNQLHTLLHCPHSSLISQPAITALPGPAPFADLTSTSGPPTPHFNRELFTRIVMSRMVFFGHAMQACFGYAMPLRVCDAPLLFRVCDAPSGMRCTFVVSGMRCTFVSGRVFHQPYPVMSSVRSCLGSGPLFRDPCF